MSKFANEPLHRVTLGPGGRPLAFLWRGRLRKVARTAEVWKDAGCWWEGEGEKTFFRLETEGGRLIEIYFDPGAPRGATAQGATAESAGAWFLYRVYD